MSVFCVTSFMDDPKNTFSQIIISSYGVTPIYSKVCERANAEIFIIDSGHFRKSKFFLPSIDFCCI